MPGIDSETKERLKSRKGIQNIPEEEKWKHMYNILFPDAEDIPSPCKLTRMIPLYKFYTFGFNLPLPLVGRSPPPAHIPSVCKIVANYREIMTYPPLKRP